MKLEYIVLSTVVLSLLSCGQPNNQDKTNNSNTDTTSVNSDDYRTAHLRNAEQWMQLNYNYSDHSYDNPFYSDRYKVYLREGNDAVMGENASSEAFQKFKDKWKNIYHVDNQQYDRGGFDPPFVKIVDMKLTRENKDTLYFDVRSQSLGYDQEKPKEDNQFFKSNVKLAAKGIDFQIDEIIYSE